ncbi:MAG: hypothetical protein IKM47_03415, partial [Bacteroidaceae bacterium]|nr:hypothetical protein [Bacteroidaceae bacterium]
QRRLALAADNCAMALSSDHGNLYDVHPKEKRPIGERLARLALNRTYGFKELTPEGPTIKNATCKGDEVCLEFDNAAGLTTNDGKEVRTFEIAAENGLYYPAAATIKEECIYLRSPKVKNPARIRYGWQPYTTANLINSDSLPASTFETNINNK